MFINLFAVVLLLLAVCQQASASDADIVFLPLETEAACLDGSPYGFWYRNGTNPKKFSISIDGGGWCYNETLCFERSKTKLGTSTLFPEVNGCDCAFFDSSGEAEEDCACAHLPYCDGASFSGYVKDAVPSSAWPSAAGPAPPSNASLTFRGIKNFDATLDILFEKFGLGNAEEVMLTGSSAGGLSTFLHLDRLANRLGPNVKTRGMPVVGFFLDHPNEAETPADYPSFMNYIHGMQNLTSGPDGGLTSACTDHFGPEEAWKCFMSPHMYPFIDTPLFMLNSKFDAWQMDNILMSKCAGMGNVKCDTQQQKDVISYGASFMDAFQGLAANPENGAFITTCICHGCPWANLVLNNTSTYQAVSKWYSAENVASNEHVYVDDRTPDGAGALHGGSFAQCVTFP